MSSNIMSSSSLKSKNFLDFMDLLLSGHIEFKIGLYSLSLHF